MKELFVREFDALDKEVYKLCQYWQELRCISDWSSRKQKLQMQEFGAQFWGTTRQALIEVIFGYVIKLTDASKTGEHENLTLHRLVQTSKNHIPKDAFKEASDIWQEIKGRRKAFNKWRNKYYSHLDRSLLLGKESMPKIPGKDLGKMIDLIFELMSFLSTYTGGKEDYANLQFDNNGKSVLDRIFPD